MIRFYVVPDASIAAITGGTFPHDVLAYGLEPVWLAWADVTTVEHDAIVADTTIYAFPEDLDTQIPNAPAVRADLEPYGIPLQWVTNGLAWRLVVRYCLFLFVFAGYLAAGDYRRRGGRWAEPSYTGTLLPDGATFNTTFAELPEPYRSCIPMAWMACGWYEPWPWVLDGSEGVVDWGIPNVTVRELIEGLEVYAQSNSGVWGEVTV